MHLSIATKLWVGLAEPKFKYYDNRIGSMLLFSRDSYWHLLQHSDKNKVAKAPDGNGGVYAGDELWYNKIFDPSSDFILTWNQIFLFSCLVALFIDPLYFYVPKIIYTTPNSCVGTNRHLAIIVTFFWSVANLLCVIHIIIKFRTAYINPSSTLTVFGRGDLVIDPKEIAWKYLRSDFAVDVVAALPLPQVTWYSSFLFLLMILGVRSFVMIVTIRYVWPYFRQICYWTTEVNYGVVRWRSSINFLYHGCN